MSMFAPPPPPPPKAGTTVKPDVSWAASIPWELWLSMVLGVCFVASLFSLAVAIYKGKEAKKDHAADGLAAAHKQLGATIATIVAELLFGTIVAIIWTASGA